MRKIVVMGGSFNPPTIAHQRLLVGAVKELGADTDIFVISMSVSKCAGPGVPRKDLQYREIFRPITRSAGPLNLIVRVP